MTRKGEEHAAAWAEPALGSMRLERQMRSRLTLGIMACAGNAENQIIFINFEKLSS